LFAIVHYLGVPAFLILIFLHGWESWFNWGFPIALIFLPASILIASIRYCKILYDIYYKDFSIADISVSQDLKFLMLYIVKPPGFESRPGQYVFLNVPWVSRF
jgi:respiratory burst oxidase